MRRLRGLPPIYDEADDDHDVDDANDDDDDECDTSEKARDSVSFHYFEGVGFL